ncbi:MAG: hypothetical protein QOJ65_2586 [Fimbriimonadaceae bacterium]|jgi:hypothetical protein|nr:hypothetical protein [Fimbriimonadaceae bacterium]
MEALPYILIISGALMALFVAWIVTTHLWQILVWKLFPKRLVVPPFGASVKIRMLNVFYESRFLGAVPQGWAIESLADAIPSPRLCEPALVEIACEKGVIRFRAQLVEHLGQQNATIMTTPVDTALADRRAQRRVKLEERPTVYIEGERAMIHDLGAGGARLSTNQIVRRGERVRLDVPGSDQPVLGHVLEVVPNGTRGYSLDLRIIFEQPIKLNDLKKKLAPAR